MAVPSKRVDRSILSLFRCLRRGSNLEVLAVNSHGTPQNSLLSATPHCVFRRVMAIRYFGDVCPSCAATTCPVTPAPDASEACRPRMHQLQGLCDRADSFQPRVQSRLPRRATVTCLDRFDADAVGPARP